MASKQRQLAKSAIDDQLKQQLVSARAIFNRGWTPLPVYFESKRPVLDAWQKLKRGESKLQKQFGKCRRNIGFLTGPAHNGPIDVDVDGDDVSTILTHYLPDTSCKFGRKGAKATHYLYDVAIEKTLKYQDPQKEDDAPRAMLIEIRANGHFTVGPGSVHDNGDKVVWEQNGDPAKVDADELTNSVRKGAACALLARYFPNSGKRHDALLALTGLLIDRDWPEESVTEFAELIAEHNRFDDANISAMVSGAADKRGTEPLAGANRLRDFWPDKVVANALKWLAIDSKRGGELRLHETGIATAFIDRHGGNVRYLADKRQWFTRHNEVWREDKKRAVEFLVRTFLDEINVEQEPRLGSDRAVKAVLSQSGNDPRVTLTKDQLDLQDDLIGTPGGIFDLRTGKPYRGIDDPLITKMTSVAPDPAVRHPVWDDFLDQMTMGDDKIVRFLQSWCGYCLTGDTSEHAMLILYGKEGRNGKTTFIEVIENILFEYAATTDRDLFISGGRPHFSALSNLVGARVVPMPEMNKNTKWNEPLLKAFTGGDKLPEKGMYASQGDFRPKAKLIVGTNKLPEPESFNKAMTERLQIYQILFSAERKDTSLKDRLRAEYPGILAWMMAGSRRFYRKKDRAFQSGSLDKLKKSIFVPRQVREFTRQHFYEHDFFQQWWDMYARVEEGGTCTPKQVAASFNAYLDRLGEDAWRTRDIGYEISDRGFKSESTRIAGRQERVYRGLALRKSPRLGA